MPNPCNGGFNLASQMLKGSCQWLPHLSFPSVSGFKKNLPSGQGKLVLRNWAPSSLLGQQKGWEEVVPKVAVFPVTVFQL